MSEAPEQSAFDPDVVGGGFRRPGEGVPPADAPDAWLPPAPAGTPVGAPPPPPRGATQPPPPATPGTPPVWHGPQPGPSWQQPSPAAGPQLPRTSPPTRGPRIGVLLAMVGVPVLVALVLTQALTSPRSGPTVPAPASTARSHPTSRPASSATSATTTARPTPSLPPVVPGWQVMASANDQAAFDVPADWKLSPGVSIGYESTSELVGAHNVAEYLPKSCKDGQGRDDHRGYAGFGQRSQVRDNRARAEELVTRWARVATSPDDGSAGPAVPVPTTTETTLMGGALPAAVSTLDVEAPGDKKYSCAHSALRITVLATWHEKLGSSITMVVVSQLGIDQPLPKDLEDRILASLRLAP